MKTRHHPLFVVLLVFATSIAAAATPAVQFDTASTVSCRDTTTDEFSKVYPHSRLVEAVLRVSALVPDAATADQLQYMYQAINPTGSMRIVDYDPKTELASDVAGNIGIENKKETSKSLGIKVSGSYSQFLNGSAGSDLGSKNATSVRYELKAPMTAVLAAGTIQRGTGVYFKMRPWAESSLEGAREFKLVMRVPSRWRGDVLYLRCTAQRAKGTKLVPLANARFVVGLYRQADDVAMLAAEQFVRAEAVLRQTVARHERDIHRKSVPSLVHRFGAMLDLYEPKLPDSWLDRVVFGAAAVERYEFARHLPSPVVDVARRYARAKQRMIQLSGKDPALIVAAR